MYLKSTYDRNKFKVTINSNPLEKKSELSISQINRQSIIFITSSQKLL